MPKNAALSLVSALPILCPILVALPACFDVQHVDPGPFYIDSFEQAVPRAPNFGPGRCDTFMSPAADGGVSPDGDDGTDDAVQHVSCAVQQPVGDHPKALTAQFDLHDPFDMTKQTVGVVVSTDVTSSSGDGSGTVDLSGFQRLVFSAILESGTAPLPSGTQLIVEIGCRPLLLGVPVVSQAVANLNIDSDWAQFPLALDDFLPSGRACLLQANSLRFSVRPGLMDGKSARGTLSIDDVYLRRR